MISGTIDPNLLRHHDAAGGRHAHDRAQVLLGLDATLRMEVDRRCTRVDSTRGLIVPAGTPHGHRAERCARGIGSRSLRRGRALRAG